MFIIYEFSKYLAPLEINSCKIFFIKNIVVEACYFLIVTDSIVEKYKFPILIDLRSITFYAKITKAFKKKIM